ncbi:MAG: STAS domain-containing protein [bacterium]
MSMEMSIRESQDIAIVDLSGEIDAQNSSDIKSRIKALISDGKVKFVINLSGVRYMDSSGLGVLVSGLKTARKDGGDLKLSGLQPEVQNIFELTQLNKVFEIYESESEAINSYR